MKKTITTLALALSIICHAQAQNRSMEQSASRPTPDAKLISQTVEGGYQVSKWMVMEQNSDSSYEFSVKYQINLAKLLSTYDNNAKELQGLSKFVDGVMSDQTKEIKRIEVTGYASPDGPVANNEKLAKERAMDCSNYIKEHYNIKNCPCSADGIALTWDDAVEAITNSSIPSKAEVLDIINNGGNQPQIEMKLRAMTTSWDYMVHNILPPMRRVEIELVYASWIEMITRTPLSPEIVDEVVVANNYFVFIDDDPSDIVMFQNQYAPLDFDDAKCKVKFKDDRHRDKLKEKERDSYGHGKMKDKMPKNRKKSGKMDDRWKRR